MRATVEWLVKILDRLFVVAGALIFSQFPLFIQQYLGRLSGHIEELSYQLQLRKDVAKKFGITLDGYTQKLLAAAEPVIHQEGLFLQAMKSRMESLQNGFNSITEANLFTKPFLFFYHADGAIFTRAAKAYSWGIPLSIEGFVYAVMGVVVAYATYTLLARFLTKVKIGLQRAKKKEMQTK